MKPHYYICALLMVLASCGEKESAVEQEKKALQQQIKAYQDTVSNLKGQLVAARANTQTIRTQRETIKIYYVDRTADQLARELKSAADSIERQLENQR